MSLILCSIILMNAIIKTQYIFMSSIQKILSHWMCFILGLIFNSIEFMEYLLIKLQLNVYCDDPFFDDFDPMNRYFITMPLLTI